MKKGDRVHTPRFLWVKIEKVFRSYETARKYKFTVPTHYKWAIEHEEGYDVVGKSLDMYHMVFAAVRINKERGL